MPRHLFRLRVVDSRIWDEKAGATLLVGSPLVLPQRLSFLACLVQCGEFAVNVGSIALWLAVASALCGGCAHRVTTDERRDSFASYVDRRIGDETVAGYVLRRTALLVNTVGGVGCATAIDRRGYLLTAAHCVGEEPVRLIVFRGRPHTAVETARVVWKGNLSKGGPDLAVLHLPRGLGWTFSWAETVRAGEPIVVCGPDYEPGVARSYVLDAIAGKVTVPPGRPDSGAEGGRFLHDAPVHPGDSGGPVVTLDGRLAGINFATARRVLLPALGWRVGTYAHRPDLDWLEQIIEADVARNEVGPHRLARAVPEAVRKRESSKAATSRAVNAE